MRRGGQISGIVSLVMIFCALCLCVFAVLTLSAADRERALSERTAEQAAEYYEADRIAAEKVAALNGRDYPDGAHVSFSVPAGETQTLEVEVQKDQGQFKILRWQTVYSGSWTTDNHIEVWSGN